MAAGATIFSTGSSTVTLHRCRTATGSVEILNFQTREKFPYCGGARVGGSGAGHALGLENTGLRSRNIRPALA